MEPGVTRDGVMSFQRNTRASAFAAARLFLTQDEIKILAERLNEDCALKIAEQYFFGNLRIVEHNTQRYRKNRLVLKINELEQFMNLIVSSIINNMADEPIYDNKKWNHKVETDFDAIFEYYFRRKINADYGLNACAKLMTLEQKITLFRILVRFFENYNGTDSKHGLTVLNQEVDTFLYPIWAGYWWDRPHLQASVYF